MLQQLRNALFQLIILGFAAPLPADVFLDQVGYPAVSPKYVFVSEAADSFFLKDAATNNTLYRNQLSLFIANDPATGLTLYRGDFSDFQAPGEYYIEADGSGVSHPFAIRDSVYLEVYKKALKGFYFQRCGMDLVGPYAAPYYRSQCHLADGFYHSTTGQTGFRLTTGGWHDAGDYGKYTVNAGISVGTLLMAYEEFPDRFARDDLNIPGSGNGIPDILDEVRYQLEWLLKMQDPSDGGVYFKVTRENFAPYIMPANDTATRYIYEKSSTAAGDFAAMLARAFRVYLPFDSLFAQDCLSAAESAWSYLAAHPSIVPPGGFHNPPGTNTGEYGDGDDRDERLWAAAELFISTGNSQYHNYYISHYTQQGLISGQMGWPNVQVMAHLAYLRGQQAGINSAIQNALRNSLTNYCQGLHNLGNGSGFHAAMVPNDYYWGSNAVLLNRAILLIFGFEESGDAALRNAALDQLHYILGANAHNLCFITGTGELSPMHPHHRPSIADGIVEPIPGLLAGGPNKYLNDPILQANFTSSTPAALCYIDHQESYASNEIAINWNAPLVFVSGYFSVPDPFMGLILPGENFPESLILDQNYPNPFNGSTVIRFHLPFRDQITLQIFDQLGRRVFEENMGMMPAGAHWVVWDGTSGRGEPLASGIYYYLLRAGTTSQARKMVYLR